MDVRFAGGVAAGGALGASARWGLESAWPWAGPTALPWTTLLINVGGCLLLGLFLGIATRRPALAAWRPFLAVGVLGGFTTYSAFAVETVRLADAGTGSAALYVALSLVLGLLAADLGERFGVRVAARAGGDR